MLAHVLPKKLPNKHFFIDTIISESNLSFQSVVPSLLSVVNRPISDSRAASPDLSNGHRGSDPASAVVTEIILVQQESASRNKQLGKRRPSTETFKRYYMSTKRSMKKMMNSYFQALLTLTNVAALSDWHKQFCGSLDRWEVA